ncbi:hypothetical protein GWA97_04540 [Flavobacterium sp. LaA7.5]|nr:hypothetical protein [Flavobacterium salilacus subsp. altitudinum]
MKYKLAYIDENDGWLLTFYQTFKNDFDVLKIKVNAESSINNILETVFSNNADGIVTDFLLNEEGDVDFNGNKIVDKVKAYKPHFPLIMLTSYEPEAISQMDDVNIVNGKDILDGESNEKIEIFKTKIKATIERYYSKIKNTHTKIERLVKKKNDIGLEPNEEEELTKLFILLDELEPEGKEVQTNLIQNESITKLNEFVRQTREILEELKKTNQND